MPQNFLIIRWSGMGDIVMTLPALSLLKKHFPGCHISYLTDTPFKEILELSNLVDHVVGIDRRGFQSKHRFFSSVKGLFSSLYKLRKNQIDLAFDLQGFGETALLAYLSGAGTCMGKKKNDIIRKNIYTLTIDADWALDHRTLYFTKAICQAADIPVPKELIHPELPVPVSVNKKTNLIGLNIGASTPNRRWPENHFIELAKTLSNKDLDVRFFLGPQENFLLEKIKTTCEVNGWEWVFHTTMPPLIDDLSECRLLVSNDTGPGHLAGAMGIPVVTLFSTGDPENVKPLAPETAWFRNDQDIGSIPVQDVLDACLTLL